MMPKLTTCTFCGAGCGIYLETAGNRVVGAYPSMSHPSNEGRICLRGWHVHEVASSPDRLTSPLVRKNGHFQKVTWDEAFAFVAERLGKIRDQWGPDSLAFLDSPRCSNEEAYLLQKFARAIIGTNNVGHGAGVYSNNSISVLMDMLGVPAATNSFADLSDADLIVVDGIDLGRQMPTVAGRVLRSKLRGAKLMIIDPRRHRLAENADYFLQIRPGTEALLYGAIAKVIIDRGLMNLAFIAERCEGYERFLEHAQNCDLLLAAEQCGVSTELISAAAVAYGQARAAAILYSTGIEARDEKCIRAVVNLALLTGNIGKEGAGVFPLTEQNNLQGVCDMGMLPDRLPGYRTVTDPRARMVMERIWKAPVPERPGCDAESLLADRGGGRVRALWLGRYDPITTAQMDVSKSLEQCELVVTQHLFMTDSADYAHVVLPTTAFGEEEVTFTSAERRIQLARRVIDAPPGPMPAWEQLARLANVMGERWHYDSAAAVMSEIYEAVPFYSGASYENLAREYGRQWPCTKDHPMGSKLLFSAPTGRPEFRFVPAPAVVLESRPAEFPFTLVFGHSVYYWHQNVLIQHSEILKREYRVLLLDYPDGFVEINTDDAKALGIRDGARIRLRAAGGSVVSTARVTQEVRSGTAYVPYFVSQLKRELAGAEQRDSLIPVRVEKEAA